MKIGITTVVAFATLTGTTAFGADLLVPGAYATIQDAIDAAVGGDRVMIAPGTYFESIDFLGKQIVVRSEDRDPETVTIDAGGLGRAVHFSGVSTPDARLIGVTVTGGDHPLSGGGIRIEDGDPRIARCIIRGNAANTGAGIDLITGSPDISQCLIYDNTANGAGGGMYLNGVGVPGNPTVTNCVIGPNTSGPVYPTIYVNTNVTMRNCIVGSDSGGPQLAEFVAGQFDVQYCAIQGGWPGTGNIDQTPGFVDLAGRDYRLTEGSPCIDAGDSSAVANIDTDLDFNPRKLSDPHAPNTGTGGSPLVDMGAYEYIPGVRYVDDDASGAGTGLTWEDAYPDFRDAIDDAAADPSITELWVAEGTYRPDQGTGDREMAFELVDGMAWYGGFAGTEFELDERDLDANESVLSGAIGASGTADNSRHVVLCDTDFAGGTIDGFIVQKGSAESSTGGGGIRFDSFGSTWTVRNCWVRLNENAGVYGDDLAGSVLIENSRINRNTGPAGGGARFPAGNVVLVSCVIAANETSNGAYGAGIDIELADVELRNCTVYGNTNTAGDFGGIYADAGTIDVANSIVWGNTGASGTLLEQNLSRDSATGAVTYSTVEGADYAFGLLGNNGVDPSFVDLDGPNDQLGDADDRFDLQANSHAIDSANNAAVFGQTLDFVGGPRFMDDPGMPDTGFGASPIVDRGAVEFAGTSCAYDCDGDGTVGFTDLTIVLGSWGPTGGDPTCDYEPTGGDGSIGFVDLVALLGNWGPCVSP